MRPKIVPGQEVTLIPVAEETTVKVGDAVLCQVGKAQFLHLVKATDGDRFVISNYKGRVNGTIPKAKIYGKLV